MGRQDDDRIVFSSEHGRLCPHCGAPSGRCRCKKKKAAAPPPTGDGIVRVSRTRRGRKGKTVTLVEGVPVSSDALRDLARWLYRQLEREFDHLSSDEAVDETIVANDYTFTESGRRFG